MTFTIPKLLSPTHIRSAILKIVENFTNYPELNEDGKIDPSLIDVDSSNRFVTDVEKSTWNGKQNALGFTPENQANKENTTLDTSSSKYPTNNLVKTNLDLKHNLLFDGDFLEFSPKNGYFYSDSFLQNSTPNTGNIVGTTASNGAVVANLVLMNAISSTQISRPSAGITPNLQGSAVLRYIRVSCRIGPGCTIQQEAHVSFRSFTATGYTSIYIGLDSIGTATSIPANDVLTGSGLFWRWNPTLNSGKLQLIKNIAGTGITVLLNTNYSITDDIIYKLGIKYIKSTDTAYFYYDRVLIHTQSTINLPNNIELYDVIAVNTSNSQAVNKLIHWHQINGLIKYA